MGSGELRNVDVLKAVKCLYDQVSKCKGFQDRDWPADTSPFEVFTWLCKQADEISKRNKSVCTLQQTKKGNQYRIVEGYHMAELDFGAKLPVSWLPSILNRWPELHEFAVQIFSCLLKERQVPFYNNFMPGSWMHEHMRELIFETGDPFDALQSALTFYSHSHPKIYWERFKEAGSPPDQMNKVPLDEGAYELYRWLLGAIPLCRAHENFWNYIGDPTLLTGQESGDLFIQGQVITPGECWGIVWSTNERDYGWHLYGEELESSANHYGWCGPGYIKMLGEDPPIMHKTWIHKIGDWLSDGIRLIAKLEKKGLIHDIYHEHTASLHQPETL